ncbi:MAG: DUF1415 family protein [Myxococcota bacterium]
MEPNELSELQRQALAQEALRVYQRYEEEIVEGLSFCPFAEKARLDQQLSFRVHLGDNLESVAPLVEAVAADDTIHVGLLILPLSDRDRLQHERFVAKLREAHAAAHGGSPPLAMAPFHYEAEANLESAAKLVPFVRRTPDPTIQLVRISVLEALRAPFDEGTDFVDLSRVDLAAFLARPLKKPLHERIAQTNLETVKRLGLEAVEARFQDIRKDRDRSYSSILASP